MGAKFDYCTPLKGNMKQILCFLFKFERCWFRSSHSRNQLLHRMPASQTRHHSSFFGAPAGEQIRRVVQHPCCVCVCAVMGLRGEVVLPVGI